MPKTDLEDSYNKEVGRRIANAQEALGISDFEAAGRIDMDVRAYRIYRSGDRAIKAYPLHQIAKALNVSADHLLGLNVAVSSHN